MFVTFDFVENAHTVEGSLLHERADSSERTERNGLIQTRTVYLYSTRYGLTGIADVIEEQRGDIYPVEYKKGRKGEWKNDQLQLCAQALCLEEMLRLPQPIPRAFLYYASTAQRQEVRLDDDLRAYTLRTIEAVRTLIETQTRPETSYTPRCSGCSLYPVCLPREIKKLRNVSMKHVEKIF
ncbi:CRISPR-associated protein Cas4 [Candidatus Vecturithrix granuli]|uniref:CRISPR-associated exonuclease Cas4 n=1 Tax=Vecturithrix granuli TaxID=1499967 RepID=A0A081CA98_VECG1|nr:CRISPR-associated protein Cas4 [Candidatus Vecturithrix granuli]